MRSSCTACCWSCSQRARCSALLLSPGLADRTTMAATQSGYLGPEVHDTKAKRLVGEGHGDSPAQRVAWLGAKLEVEAYGASKLG